MEQPRYITQTGRNRKVYQFVSEGSKGNIIKRVYFEETTLENYVSLMMGIIIPIPGKLIFIMFQTMEIEIKYLLQLLTFVIVILNYIQTM